MCESIGFDWKIQKSWITQIYVECQNFYDDL